MNETLAHQVETQPTPVSRERLFEKPDVTTIIGYLLLALSAGLYALEEYRTVVNNDQSFTIFFIHYFIAIVFVVVLLAEKSWGVVRSWRKEHVHKTIILLNLFLISAYALNRKLPVFAESVPWLCVCLILISLVLLSYHYLGILPKTVRCIHHILLGSGLVLYLYMTIYVANFYIIGSFGIIMFGIGAHIFVPLLLFYTSIKLVITSHKEGRIGVGWVILGIVLTINFIIGFIGVWQSRVKDIDRLANHSVIYTDAELPTWVKIAQAVKNDWLTESILKSHLVYTVSNDHLQWDFFPVGRDWDESRKHDPLIFISSGFGTTALSDEDRKNILKTLGDSRHKAMERLWSGDNLTTSYIITDVDIYPDLRIAYSEQYMNVRNNSTLDDRWWGNTEEAIYTFQLPEGSVVTSLSLWINGKEEKAILTSKQKATEAYKTIVGRESRDPSVVHWQEGNTISVRVFPCTPGEERKFKIGITTPLSAVDGKLIYKSITFKGPGSRNAAQTSRVRILGESANVEFPGSFRKNVKGEFVREGSYDPDLEIIMDAPIKRKKFSFDGFTYSLSELTPSMSEVGFTDIYLDLNDSWTDDEIGSLRPLLNDYHVHAYTGDEFISLLENNWDDVTDELSHANFSLFPFHRLPNTYNSLVITKGKGLSPQLQDFKGSQFALGVSDYFASGKKVYVFGLNNGASTYIKSLRELRAFNFAQGDIEQLSDFLKTKKFPLTEESDERVVLYESGIVIEKKPMTSQDESSAPDHLARLFAYNDIMRQVGANFFKADFVNEKLVDEAATAYVVSPVSSLVVLETKEDYERFGIADKENSLHNASKDSSGAVPEPREWALIIIFLLFVAFHVFRYSKTKPLFVRK